MSEDFDSIPFVTLPGSKFWEDWYRIGQELERLFPGQSCSDLALCVSFNDRGPLKKNNIFRIECIQEGEGDGDPWIWIVTLDGGRQWRMTGWSDFSGWDCCSGNVWE